MLNNGNSITQYKKILVVRFSSLGDVLLTTPIIRALKNKYNEAQIHVIVKKEFADVFAGNNNLSRVLLYEKESDSEIKTVLTNEKYDLVVDLQNNWRSRKLLKGVSTNIIRFKKPTFAKIMLVHFKINLLKEKKSIVKRYAETAGVVLDEGGLEIFVPQETKAKLESKGNYIGFAPGAKHFTKRWPPEYFVDLGSILSNAGYQIVIFGGRSDKQICDNVSSNIKNSLNLQNEDKLHQTVADMKLCKLILTNDSGLMHAASAAGVPLVSIFGSTVKDFGFVPFGVQNLILENNSLFCRPCSHIGKSNCPKTHFKCMKEITPGFVLKHLQNLLQQL